jgi:hypothetical protein
MYVCMYVCIHKYNYSYIYIILYNIYIRLRGSWRFGKKKECGGIRRRRQMAKRRRGQRAAYRFSSKLHRQAQRFSLAA